LISQDHMEREKDNANLFKYLAWCDLDDKLLLQLLQIANQMMILNHRKSVPFKADIYFIVFFYHTSTALLYIKSEMDEEVPFLLVQYYSCYICVIWSLVICVLGYDNSASWLP
jgi:hypothetical protein